MVPLLHTRERRLFSLDILPKRKDDGEGAGKTASLRKCASSMREEEGLTNLFTKGQKKKAPAVWLPPEGPKIETALYPT